MGDSSTQPKETVLVTGFKPFGNHVVNSSWVAVQELTKLGLGENVNLIVHEIPVEYEAVSSLVPALWTQYKPTLVVHVGVSGIAKMITLEQQAHNDGYENLDVKGRCPAAGCCVAAAPACLSSRLDMRAVCDAVNTSGGPTEAVVSHDPGRYLCDFTYFLSLRVDAGCTAFIHVPPLHKPYSALQLAHGIRHAIRAMLTQLQTGSQNAGHTVTPASQEVCSSKQEVTSNQEVLPQQEVSEDSTAVL